MNPSMRRRFIVFFVCLALLVPARPAKTETLHSVLVEVIVGIVVVAAAITTAIVLTVRHKPTVTGCAVQGPGGLQLQNEGDQQTFLLNGDIAGVSAGERVTTGFLRDAAGFFAARNVQVRALLTDNGSAYRSDKFRAACAEMQIKHRRTRPYTPRTNGKAERFIQTTLREWAYAHHWQSSDQRDAQLQPWVDFYNHQRPHGSLNHKPPVSRLGNATTS